MTELFNEHPAVEWALQAEFSPCDVDCTTVVVLKILDNKCKMLPGEKAAVLAIYDAVRQFPAELFGNDVHDIIHLMRNQKNAGLANDVHQLRVQAEAKIPKPVMKQYKAFLREGLFGE